MARGLVGVVVGAIVFMFGWPRFPWWYNLGVVIPAVPAVMFGGKLAVRGT